MVLLALQLKKLDDSPDIVEFIELKFSALQKTARIINFKYKSKTVEYWTCRNRNLEADNADGKPVLMKVTTIEIAWYENILFITKVFVCVLCSC